VSPKRAQARKPLAKPNHGKDGYLSANDGDRVGDRCLKGLRGACRIPQGPQSLYMMHNLAFWPREGR
jgi:hypothetical protein